MSAVISACGRYRYRLEREVQPEGLVFAYFGINPSTANADLDDATVRKWRGFTLRNGGRRFIVGNVFSFRATDVTALKRLNVADCNGPEAFGHLLQIIADADVLVPCWGTVGKVSPIHRSVVQGLLRMIITVGRDTGRPVLHFGTTADGSPKHPLMLSYETLLTPWTG